MWWPFSLLVTCVLTSHGFEITGLPGVNDTVAQNRTKLYIAAFIPDLYYDDGTLLDYYMDWETIKLAVEGINNHPNTLDGYQLIVYGGSTGYEGDLSTAMNTLLRFIEDDPKKLMFIGPAFSRVTRPIAEGLRNWAINEITPTAVSPSFRDQSKFPFLIRCTPASTSEAMTAVIRHFGWSRVSIVHEYDPDLFSPVSNYVRNDILAAGYDVIAIEGVRDDTKYSFSEQMKKIKESDTRIVIGLFYMNVAINVFCEAYKQGFYGPRYVWILMGTLNTGWWDYGYGKSNCTTEELKLAAGNYFSVSNIILRSDNNRSISGLTGLDFLWSLYNRTNGYYYAPASYTYDSTWAVALALNKTIDQIDLQNYEYANKTMATIINEAFKKVAFEGLTGPVAFNQYGERIGTMIVEQNRNGTAFEIAEYFVASDQLVITPSQADKLWSENGGRIPNDRTIEKREVQVLPLSLLIIMWLLSSIGLVYAIVILFINIKHRDLRLIKMSSPTFNNVILIGGMLCYLSVILFGVDSRFLSNKDYGVLCNIRAWTMGLGFTLAFGAMFSKTWRVHRIFTAARTLKKKSIRDVHLFGLLFGLLFIEVAILGAWMIASPFSFKLTELEHEEDPQNDVVLVPQLVQCSSEYETQFLLGIFTYKGILLLFGLFLAWETRKIQIPVLNDSKYIGMSVYNVVVLSAVGTTISMVLQGTSQNTASYALISLCIIIGTTVTLFLVFIPKLLAMRSIDAMEVETTNATIMTARIPSVLSHQGVCDRCKACPCRLSSNR